jgi:hypothetical protein
LAANTDTPRLAVVLRTELHGTSVGNALEVAAIFVVGAFRVGTAVGETLLLETRPASARDALLRVGAGPFDAGQKTLSVDADPAVRALEVELTREGLGIGVGRPGIGLRRGRVSLEGIQAEAVRVAGRPEWALLRALALGDAADRGAHFVDRAVIPLQTRRPGGSRLRVALVTLAEKTAAIARGTVGDADVAGIVVAGGDPEERDEKEAEAFHELFDAPASGLFTVDESLKPEQFRRITTAT